MTTLQTLHVKHTVTHLQTPLVWFCDLPGYDAELTPQQIRQLAAAMLRAADDCEALFEQTRRYGPVRRGYLMTKTDDAVTHDEAGFEVGRPVFGPLNMFTSADAPRAPGREDRQGDQCPCRCPAGTHQGTSSNPPRVHVGKTEGHQ
jgi:hypothetical protein